MPTPAHYDLLVLGSGEAGKYLAWTLAAQGQRVAVIERRYVGGSCPNIACLPSKNVIQSAKVASLFRRGPEFGLPPIDTPADMAAVRARKRAMVDGLVAMHQHKFNTSGAELIMGAGTFIAPRTLAVTLNDGGTRTLEGENVVICTGSRARLDSTPGLKAAAPLTHIEALELDALPAHLAILGGGYIGLEFAQAFRRLGCPVTILDRNASLIHREDPDVTAAVADFLRAEGVEILDSAVVERVEGRSGQQVTLHLLRNGSPHRVEASHLLAAGGRTPNTDGIGLELAGVALTPSHHIQVDDQLRTTATGVWAVGDCAGSPHFTHVAFDDFRIVRDTLAGHPRSTRDRQIPFCLFTDPEVARVGLNEREAHDQNIPYRLAKIPTESVLRSRTLSETRGFLKALIARDDDRILGFAAVAPDAGELLAPVQLAMASGLPCTALRDLVLTHPTMTEGLNVLFQAVPARS